METTQPTATDIKDWLGEDYAAGIGRFALSHATPFEVVRQWSDEYMANLTTELLTEFWTEIRTGDRCKGCGTRIYTSYGTCEDCNIKAMEGL